MLALLIWFVTLSGTERFYPYSFVWDGQRYQRVYDASAGRANQALHGQSFR